MTFSFRSSGRIFAAAIMAASVLALGGCGDKNPLIGRWKMAPGATTEQRMAAGQLGEIIEFQEKSLVTPDGFTTAIPVQSYTHDGDRWFVQLQPGISLPVSVTGKGEISVELSAEHRIRYVKG
ncbi:hypothetical protein UAJ10_05230 [Nitrospirillum sp. BR 11164]|uniref:hypothetical protein n=1 Tax=Nitrospirillum sp. BR 11164 TaxID=3104324 RepID=UPI002AFFC22F|nr:hypothetical protein [Nitrospirillum sp. BR 11164]MEA1648414.1 hypothetical protein [Nitrospirillum sp. BR 11164]